MLNGAPSPERVVARGRALNPGGGPVSGEGGDGGPEGLSGPLAEPICLSQLGGAPLKLPCDASSGNEAHTVRLWVNGVCRQGRGWGDDAPNCWRPEGLVNPCPGPEGCTVTAQCTPDVDVPIAFNLGLLASDTRGWHNVPAILGPLSCGARFDTCYDDTPIELVLDTRETIDGAPNPQHGERIQTMIASVGCIGGGNTGLDTHLAFGAVRYGCGGEVQTLDLSTIREEGPVTGVSHPTVVRYGAYEVAPDLEQLYLTLAVGMTDTRCFLDLEVVPSNGPFPTVRPENASTHDSFGFIRFEGSADLGACTRNELTGQGDQVRAYYDAHEPLDRSALHASLKLVAPEVFSPLAVE